MTPWPVRRLAPALFLCVAAGVVGLRPAGPTAAWVAGPGFAALAAVAVAGCLWRITRDGPDPRPAWLLLLVSCVVEAGVRVTAPDGTAAFPTFRDSAHVLALVLLAAGLAKLPGIAEAGTGWRLAGDGIGVGFATVFLVGRPVVTGLPGPGVAAYAAIAHVVASVIVATAALVVLSRLRHPGGPALRCMGTLSVAALAAVAGDTATVVQRVAGGYRTGSLADLGWVVAVGLVAVAASSGPTQDNAAVTVWRERLAVLGLVLPAAAVTVLSAAPLARGQGFDAVSGLSLLGLASVLLVRHAIARVDNLVITRTLEERVAERTLGLVTREQWFRSLVQNSSDVLTVIDAGGVVRYQSPAVSRVFGHEPQVLVGQPLTYLMRPADAERFVALLAGAIRTPRATSTLECALWHKDGRWCETETTMTSLLDDEDIRGLVLNIRDISERRRLEDALTYQAFHDTLTGLANRVLFTDRVSQALSLADTANQVGVLFLDLDGFKAVNDTQGHAVGDQLLGLVAERLQRCVRPADTVARLGGDEFGVLVHGQDCAQAAVWIAERISQAIAEPFVLDGRDISIGVSTGIAFNVKPGESSDMLLRNADVAMYKAKARRDGSWVRFEPGMRDALLDQLELESDLKLALSRGQLAVYFQPTVELRHGYVVGAEALLRWHHPTRGMVAPEGFIALAEQTGLINQIGDWVLRETCRQGARWQVWAPPGEHFHVAVNISARQVAPALVRSVAEALAESGLPPGALVLEITESLLVERTDQVLDMLHQLKALGVRLAIDDFGTGYSSLSYLSRFPVDILKMDKSFVEVVAATGNQSELAKTIIHLGRSMRMATVAEGIETQTQYAALTAMGCDYGQGYLFARALPPAGLDELLSCRLVTQRTGLGPQRAPQVLAS